MKNFRTTKIFGWIIILLIGFSITVVGADHEGGGGGGGACNCYYGCDKVVPSERSISVVAFDAKGQPLTFNDTTNYACTLRYTQCCPNKENLCKKVIEKTSTFEKTILEKQEYWNTYQVSAKTTFKCDDNREQTTGSFQKTLRIRDCSLQNKTLESAMLNVLEKCVKPATEIEAKCSVKKLELEGAEDALQEKESELKKALMDLEVLKEELQKSLSDLLILESKRNGLNGEISKAEEELSVALKNLEDAKRASIACWEEGTLQAIGPEGTISGVMTFIGMNWRNLVAYAFNDQENLENCKAKTCVEFAQDKLKSAQKTYERALEKFNSAKERLNEFDESFEGLRLKELADSAIPSLEEQVKEKQKLIESLNEDLEELKEAVESAKRAFEDCAGIECKSARENEAIAKQELQKCLNSN